MRRLGAVVLFLLCLCSSASADSLVVQTCGTLPLAYAPGATRNDTIDVNGNKCVDVVIGGGSSTSNQGTPNTIGNAWPVKITDGTNIGAVTAASTAPTAAQPAQIVAISPNGINANGSATSANSAPVVIASDQAAVTTKFADPCMGPAKSSKAINITSATTTALVAVSGSTAVYVCSFSLSISQVISTANTLLFEYGTGTACASGATALTGTYGSGGVTVAAPIVVTSGGGTLFTAPASNGLCAVTAIGGTGSFQGVLTYVQQ